MSLNVMELNLDGKTVCLRLTTKAIGAFVLKHGMKDAPPIASVLGAMDNLDAKCDLLTGALTYPDNHNTIRSGDALLDMLADEGYTPEDINWMILDLAKQAGLVGQEDCGRLKEASQANTSSTVDKLVGLLRGTMDVTGGSSQEPAEATDSPT